MTSSRYGWLAIVLALSAGTLGLPRAARAAEPPTPNASAPPEPFPTAPDAPPPARADEPVTPNASAPPEPLPTAPNAAPPARPFEPVIVASPPGQPSYVYPPNLQAWKPGDAVPPGYKRVKETRKKLFRGGLIPLAVMWGISASLGGLALATGSNKVAAGIFIIPVAGPFIDLATQTMRSGERYLVIFDGAVQTLGATLMISGLVWKKEKIVPVAYDLHVAPVVTRDFAGLGLSGAF